MDGTQARAGLEVVPPPVAVTGRVVVLRDSEAGGGIASAHRDPESLGVAGERAVGELEVPLDPAQGLSVPPVAALEQALEFGAGEGEGQWHRDPVVAVTAAPYDGWVWNLAVEGDETYLADGLVVHNCRSTIKPLLDYAKLGIPAPARTRETYPEWLARQPADVQDGILGPARGRLFRAGKVTLPDLVRTDGRTVTLEELARRLGLPLAKVRGAA